MDHAFVHDARAIPSARRRMSAGQRAALNLYLVATNAHWTAILISLPLQAELIVCNLQCAI